MRGILLLSEGRLSQVEQLLDESPDFGRQVQAWDAEASYRLGLALLRWEQGRLAEIEDLMRDALVRFPGYRVFRCFLALCYLETGRSAEAATAVEELLAGGQTTLSHNNDWYGGDDHPRRDSEPSAHDASRRTRCTKRCCRIVTSSDPRAASP